MLDEQLIHEVQNHAIIYNRQKYFLNSSNPLKYLSKEDAWQEIAMNLNTDVETCKKRWKYLRERYVQQRKQGDTPHYEHLSRPYLEKMKFLDKHIQPRKSYKHVTNFLSSPSGNGSFPECMDSSRSNGSLGNIGYHSNYENNFVKQEPQANFPNFTTTDLSHQAPHHSHSEQNAHYQHQQQQQQSTREFLSANNTSPKRQTSSSNSNNTNNTNNGQLIQSTDFRDVPSSSSSAKSMKSPLSSPQETTEHINDTDLKRPRIDVRVLSNDESSESDEPNEERHNLLPNLANSLHNLNARFSSVANQSDLIAMYQQQFSQQPTTTFPMKCSEQLLGELVTSELLKMTSDRRKIAQRRILEILFFDD